MVGWIVAAIAGSVAGYYWHDRIRHYMADEMPHLRDRAAQQLGAMGERASGALDRAKTAIDSTVRTGQDRLKQTGTPGESHPSGPGHRAAP